MRRFLFLAAAVVFVVVLVFTAEDVRAPFGWALTAYLLFRAAPAVRRDLAWVGRYRSGRRFPRVKGDTL